MKAENYEYNLPEDFTLRQEVRLKLDNLIDEVNAKGYIDNTTAQRLLDLHVEMLNEYATKLEETYGSLG